MRVMLLKKGDPDGSRVFEDVSVVVVGNGLIRVGSDDAPVPVADYHLTVLNDAEDPEDLEEV